MDDDARGDAARACVLSAYDDLSIRVRHLRKALRPLLAPEAGIDETVASALDRLRRQIAEAGQEADAVAQRLEHVATASADPRADAAAAYVIDALSAGLAETVRDRADSLAATAARLYALLGEVEGSSADPARAALAAIAASDVDALRDAAAALEASLARPAAPEDLGAADLGWLEALYTMQAERALHDAALTRAAAPAETTTPVAAPAPPPRRQWRTRVADLVEASADPAHFIEALVLAFLAIAAAFCAFLPAQATVLVPTAILYVAAAKLLYDRVRRRLSASAEAHRRLAYEDALTGTLNRRGLLAQLDALLRTRPGTSDAVTVLHIDLDHFKAVNDTLGHEAGDHVLGVASARMAEVAGRGALVGRIGGDEFCVVLAGPAAARATEVAGGIVAALRERIDWQGNACAIGASVGVATGGGAEGPHHPERLLADADLATYTAKSEGRGRYAVFDARLRAEMAAEARVVAALARAIEHERIEVWFQPVVDRARGAVASVEALARWHDPDLGAIAPERAFDLAERHNLLDRLHALVLARTLAAVTGWREAGLEPPRVSLNLSRTELRFPDLADRIVGAIEAAGLSPERFAVEAAEADAGGRGAALAQSALAALRERGVGVVLDRFGRDQVSLAAVAAMGPSAVKLDRALVGELGANEEGLTLLRGLVGLSRSLSLDVIATGIETGVQLAILDRLGCDALQGFAVARPMAPDSLAEWLRFEGTPDARPDTGAVPFTAA